MPAAEEPFVVVVPPKGWSPKTPGSEAGKAGGDPSLIQNVAASGDDKPFSWDDVPGAVTQQLPKSLGEAEKQIGKGVQGFKDHLKGDDQPFTWDSVPGMGGAQGQAPPPEMGGDDYDSAQELSNFFQMNPPANMSKSAPPQVQYNFDRASGPNAQKEAKLYLDSVYGPQNVAQYFVSPDDTTGTWMVREGKEWVPVLPQGTLPKWAERQGMEALASGPAMAGAWMGAARGARLGGMVPGPPMLKAAGAGVGALAGGGLGWAGGQGLSDLVKAGQGYLVKTPSEETDYLIGEAEFGAVAEAVPRSIAGVFRGGGKFYRWFTGANEVQDTIRELNRRGYKWSMRLLDAPGLASEEKFSEAVAGKAAMAHNLKIFMKDLREVMKAQGWDEGRIQDAMDAITAESAVPIRTVGDALTRVAQERYGELYSAADKAFNKASSLLQTEINKLAAEAQTTTGIGSMTSEAIRTQETAVKRRMNTMLRDAFQVAGTAPVVDMTPVINRARQLRDKLVAMGGTEAELPSEIKNLLNMVPGTSVSVEEAHNLRVGLREIADYDMGRPFREAGYARTAEEITGLYDEIADAGDEAFDAVLEDVSKPRYPGIVQKQVERQRAQGTHARPYAPASVEGAGAEITGTEALSSLEPANTNGLPSEAIKMLRDANNFYRANIPKFQDVMAKRIVRMAKTGIEPSPYAITKLLMNPDNKNSFAEVLGYIDRMPDAQVLKDAIVKSDINRRLTDAMIWDETTGAWKIDAQGMLTNMKPRDLDVMKMIYPPAKLDEINRLMRQLAALDGKLDISALKGGAAIDAAVKDAIYRQTQFNAMVDINPLQGLLSGLPDAGSRAVREMTRPGNEEMLERIMMAIGGTDSPTAQKIKDYFFSYVLSEALSVNERGVIEVSGPAVYNILKQYSPEMLKSLGIQDSGPANLIALGKIMRQIFSGTAADTGMSMAAQETKLHIPFGHAARLHWIKAKLFPYIFQGEAMRNIWADTYKNNPAAAKNMFLRGIRFMLNDPRATYPESYAFKKGLYDAVMGSSVEENAYPERRGIERYTPFLNRPGQAPVHE